MRLSLALSRAVRHCGSRGGRARVVSDPTTVPTDQLSAERRTALALVCGVDTSATETSVGVLAAFEPALEVGP
ncbi:hypothetical protein C0Q63_22745 [Streptomyces albidoflavus]|nr:hypothetical protein C0Q63_22745 [Streptomyces albidoflavus]